MGTDFHGLLNHTAEKHGFADAGVTYLLTEMKKRRILVDYDGNFPTDARTLKKVTSQHDPYR